MTLNLIEPLWYVPSGKSFDDIISTLSYAERGYDAFVLYSIEMTEDTMKLSAVCSGERNGYSEENIRRIESGLVPVREKEETASIPSGKYLFEQFPACFQSSDLPRILLPYATKPGKAYIRFFKESILESVMQLLIPQ